MGCNILQGEGGPVFICGPGINPKRKRCAFCGDWSTKLCDWPVWRHNLVPASSLKIGDRIFPFSANEHREILAIDTVRHLFKPDRLIITWEWRGAPQKGYELLADRQVKLAVKGTCDKPCCHAHHRHVGPDRDYCQEHWKQEDVL